jgi:S-ribosylhomocysteine lyase
MEKIESFKINHNTLKKGMYISRIDGDIVTYDIRMKLPNQGDFLSNAAMHSFEHLFATYARNTEFKDKIIYIGPMGCRTGFYFLVRNSLSHSQALDILKNSLHFIKDFKGKIPGTNKEECGNYLEHDLDGAKAIALDMLEVLKNWNEENMYYAE